MINFTQDFISFNKKRLAVKIFNIKKLNIKFQIIIFILYLKHLLFICIIDLFVYINRKNLCIVYF